MFEPFSRGYYLGRLHVEPHGRSRAVMSRDQHEAIDRQLNRRGEPAPADGTRPVVMKVGRRHFRVHGADHIADDSLLIPRSMTEIDSAEARPVLLAKATRADQLAELTGDGGDDRSAEDPFVPDALHDVSRPYSS